jgi:hypothetical protein
MLVLLAMVLLVGASGAVLATDNPGQGTGGPNWDTYEVSEPLFRWALGFDEEDEAMMRDAFTEDAAFVFFLSTGGDPLIFEGIDAVMALFLGAIADQTPTEQRRHVTTNVLVERVDRRTAIVTSYLTLLVSPNPNESPELRSSGVYTDTVVLESDGEWRIQERQLRLDTPS